MAESIFLSLNSSTDYLVLRRQDLTTSEIEELLILTPKERYYLQQRLRYHFIVTGLKNSQFKPKLEVSMK